MGNRHDTIRAVAEVVVIVVAVVAAVVAVGKAIMMVVITIEVVTMVTRGMISQRSRRVKRDPLTSQELFATDVA